MTSHIGGARGQPVADLADLRDLSPTVEVFPGEWQPSEAVRQLVQAVRQLVPVLAPVRRASLYLFCLEPGCWSVHV